MIWRYGDYYLKTDVRCHSFKPSNSLMFNNIKQKNLIILNQKRKENFSRSLLKIFDDCLKTYTATLLHIKSLLMLS